MTYTSRSDLIASFSSHSSVKGNCIQQWFRSHDDGSKDELIADGQCTLSFFLRIARYQIQLLFFLRWSRINVQLFVSS